ncbi:MAG: Na+/H+ antiporter subunit C [Chloroflexi bacterium]|nr:Na+/H+ antiporter subunit C [Chloroflexota bacterium]
MAILLAIVIGGLYAAGIYLLLRRSIVKLIFGLILLGHAANLLIFTASSLVRGQPPLVAEGQLLPLLPAADPLPQAFILTSIVIGFGVTAFTVVLIHRAHKAGDTDDLEDMRVPE